MDFEKSIINELIRIDLKPGHDWTKQMYTNGFIFKLKDTTDETLKQFIEKMEEYCKRGYFNHELNKKDSTYTLTEIGYEKLILAKI